MAESRTNGKGVSINDNDDNDSIEDTLNGSIECEGQTRRPEYRCLRQASDFNNVFKAFIGTSYLSFPFGFLQSGLLLGCIVLTIVVFVTGHCCHLIVDVKKYILRQRCKIDDPEEAEDDPEYQRLAHKLRFNDLGEICLGRFGPYIVDFFLVFTQTGFCVAYFIFIGNALHDIIPPQAVHSNETQPFSDMDIDGARFMRDSSVVSTVNTLSEADIPPASFYDNISSTIDALNDTVSDFSTPEPNNTTVGNWTTAIPVTDLIPFYNISDIVYVNVMPDLKYLVLAPLLPFILFGFIRDMRHMGPWSLLANLAIIVGYFTILTLMLVGFTIHPAVVYFNWSKVPVFFGQVTCAFEGIGLVLPVEASMRDNAYNFSSYLNSTLFMVSCILASFGILGYMRYGPDVAQVITMNIPSAGIVPFTLSCTLILAVTLTFPLQVFPVLEILERYILGVGKQNMMSLDEPENEDETYDEDGIDNDGLTTEEDMDNDDQKTTYDEYDDEAEEELLKSGVQVRGRKESVPVADWKRNILRVIIILCIAGLAVLLRDNFAYVGALIGAMGSTALGYILPCTFHLRLKYRELPWYIKMKDILIILLGTVGGVIGVIIVMQDIIASFS